MISYPDRISFYLILIYTILLFYYSIQLLVYTDEFALDVLGFFNHSIAGLCEIIGIIFLSLSVGLLFTVFKGTKNQNILYLTILIMQILIDHLLVIYFYMQMHISLFLELLEIFR